MTDERYVVAVKPSARRRSAAAGRWVNREGSTRVFEDRSAADAWASACSSDDAPVYVRDANPGDGTVDGYLMSLGRRAGGGGGNGTDPGGGPDGQAGLDRYGDRSEELPDEVRRDPR